MAFSNKKKISRGKAIFRFRKVYLSDGKLPGGSTIGENWYKRGWGRGGEEASPTLHVSHVFFFPVTQEIQLECSIEKATFVTTDNNY